MLLLLGLRRLPSRAQHPRAVKPCMVEVLLQLLVGQVDAELQQQGKRATADDSGTEKSAVSRLVGGCNSRQ